MLRHENLRALESFSFSNWQVKLASSVLQNTKRELETNHSLIYSYTFRHPKPKFKVSFYTPTHLHVFFCLFAVKFNIALWRWTSHSFPRDTFFSALYVKHLQKKVTSVNLHPKELWDSFNVFGNRFKLKQNSYNYQKPTKLLKKNFFKWKTHKVLIDLKWLFHWKLKNSKRKNKNITIFTFC